MNSFYTKEYTLRTNDFDMNNRIHLSAILDLFQTAAGEHAVLLGVGYDNLIKLNLIWVLTKVKLEILKQPEKSSSVIVKTWPLTPGRVTYLREYIVSDKNGNILIKGSSEWVTVNAEERKISPAGNLYNLDNYLTDKCFDEKLRKVHSFEEEDCGMEFLPCYSDIDINRHLNNTKYANYIMTALNLPDKSDIFGFQIDYHVEVKPNESFTVFTKSEENKYTVMGKRKDGTLIFTAEIKYSNS